MLEKGLKGMMAQQTLADGTSFVNEFLKHHMVSSLRKHPTDKPSYISPSTFALTVIDMVTTPGSVTFNDLETGIKNLPEGEVKTALLASIQTAQGDLAKAQTYIEAWFNGSMDRVSGWYTRRKQWITVLLAVSITLGLNADTLTMARTLWTTPTLREEIVKRSASGPAAAPAPSAAQLSQELGDLVGWQAEMDQFRCDWAAIAQDSWRHVPGWLMTIAAVSLGAPFWFDLLNRFMNIRSAGKNPNESK